MPALFTRMSTRPYFSFTPRKRFATSFSDETSAPMATASPPVATISRTTLSAPSRLVEKLTTTEAPAAASCFAIAAPMPFDAPVTTATLFASLFIMRFPFVGV